MGLYGQSGDDVRDDIGILKERIRVLEAAAKITPPPGSDDEAAIGAAVKDAKGKSVADVADTLNLLLASLRDAGIIENG